MSLREFWAREIDRGMGMAVAKRTYLRPGETWADIAMRVAEGNCSLVDTTEKEQNELTQAIAKASFLPAGRHLQHGDNTQKDRNIEVFSNCLHGDTKVLTQDYGSIEIKKLVGKSAIIKCADGEWRSSNCYSYGIQKLYKYIFKKKTGPAPKHHANFVIATRNHRWFLEGMAEEDHLLVGNILEPAKSSNIEKDKEAICHGLIFGDGAGHKRRNDYGGHIISQGRSYCQIRLCGDDKRYLSFFDDIACTINYPPSSEGDPIVYVGKRPWKEYPITYDPEYIAGFIYGWWLADGSKTYHNSDTNDTIEIATSNKEAFDWLIDHCAYGGYAVSGYSTHERKDNDGSYTNGKTLYSIRMFRTETSPFSLYDLEYYGEEKVYCFEEPVTTGFVLANGILTGNCSTACSSFIEFYLLLNGSGVGRMYNDNLMLVDWHNMPNVYLTLDPRHKDFREFIRLLYGIEVRKYLLQNARTMEEKDEALNTYENFTDNCFSVGKLLYLQDISLLDLAMESDQYVHYDIEDSREGWAKGLEYVETMAFEKKTEYVLHLDFSLIRASGSPIGGMQDRPASGPAFTAYSFKKLTKIKNNIFSFYDNALKTEVEQVVPVMNPWMQSMCIDHYMSECVANGGARRSARIALKYWKDPDILDFINLKRNLINSEGQSVLWSSNNSVGVDKEFWDNAKIEGTVANRIYKELTDCSFKTGEPGMVNIDKLTSNEKGICDAE